MKLSENITIELGENKKARGKVLSLFCHEMHLI